MVHGAGPVRWTRDVTPADWWVRRVNPSHDRVDALMPGGYEAYARLFHPAQDGGQRVSWRALAQRHGRVVHGQMRFSAISRLPGRAATAGVDAPPPTLPLPEARTLVERLRPGTATPERCWFCRWADQRSLDDQGVAERVSLPSGGRDYLLHGGPIELALVSPPVRSEADPGFVPSRPGLTAAEIEDEYVASRRDLTPAEMEAELAAWRAARDRGPETAPPGAPDEGLYRAPGLWWPEDRRWFVATEPGLASTFVGGARQLVERLIADPDLEALPAGLTDTLADYEDLPNEELDRRSQPVP